jgi:predicted DNA-binding transcriptional regulator YafY
MLMSERQWRVLSLLERLNRGEVTVGEVAASLKRSRRQVQRMRKRLAAGGAAGLTHGNAGRRPKHRTSEEIRPTEAFNHKQPKQRQEQRRGSDTFTKQLGGDIFT